ncbi:MAG: hypothetical protein V3V67_13190 [Myxococcota bacterium]
MERRPYFVFGDVLSCTVIGAVAALAGAAAVAESWGMFLGMAVGMVVGMAAALLVGFALFFWLFGALEVMVPTMLTGMTSGMTIGMLETMRPLAATAEITLGVLIGWVLLALTYVANARLSGKVPEWTS